jgi:hypothetical protein
MQLTALILWLAMVTWCAWGLWLAAKAALSWLARLAAKVTPPNEQEFPPQHEQSIQEDTRSKAQREFFAMQARLGAALEQKRERAELAVAQPIEPPLQESRAQAQRDFFLRQESLLTRLRMQRMRNTPPPTGVAALASALRKGQWKFRDGFELTYPGFTSYTPEEEAALKEYYEVQKQMAKRSN